MRGLFALPLLFVCVAGYCQQPQVLAIRQTQVTDWVPVQEQTIWREVQATTQPVADAAANTVEVLFPSGGGAASKGSGVYLGERLIATAYHVVRGTSGNGYVNFRDGTRMACTTIQVDKVWDQAILEIEAVHPTLVGVELAGRNPRAGDMLFSAGFGQGFRIFGGRMTGDWAGPGGTQTADWFSHLNPAIPGDSGGPVFNEAGQLVGCLWGTDGRHTTGTGTGRFNVFVKPLLPRLAQWRAERIGRQIQGIVPIQGGCQPGGNCYQPAPRDGGVVTMPGPAPTPAPVQPPLTLAPSNPCQPNCECDEEKIVAKLLEKMAGDERFRGPAGVAGKDGRDGKDGEVSTTHLAAITESILATIASDSRFRGPAGPQGERGPAGSAATVDVDALAQQILARVKHPSQRVVLVDGKSGKIIDDETYQPGEPIVLDFQTILRNATTRSN